jgi:hypothetical protein
MLGEYIILSSEIVKLIFLTLSSDKQKDIDFETERIRQRLDEAHKNNFDLNTEIKQLMVNFIFPC